MFVPPIDRRTVVAVACAIVAASAAAQSAETIVITGSREPMSVSRLAADVVVIDSDTLRNSAATSLADVLREQAGVQISRNGGPGAATSVMIRGATGSQTVVLVDGVRIGSATLADPSVAALPLAQIERVEVLRGPGSSLYGADAVGGVVNIITRRADTGVRFDAAAAFGSRGARELSAGASTTLGAWDIAASLAQEHDDGDSSLRPGAPFSNYNPDDDGYTRDSGQLRIGYAPAPGHRIGLALLRSRLETQVDSAASGVAPDFRDKLDVDATALDWRGTLAAGLVATVRVDRSVDDMRSKTFGPQRFKTTRDHALAQLAWQTAAGQFVAAVERLDEDARTNDYRGERDTDIGVLSWTGTAGRFSWQADLRRDDSSDYGGETTGRLGGSFALTPQWRLRALAGNSFRAPSFNDLLYPYYGVDTIKPERGRSLEFGLEWADGGDRAGLTVFRNRVKNLINYQPDRSFCPPDPGFDYGCAGNTSRARLQGATLSGAKALGDWALRAQVDFLDAKNSDTGARLPRRAAHQETLGVDWHHADWSAGASVLRVGARPDSRALDAETTLDLKAGWRFAKGWMLESRLLNATDEDIEPAAYYRGPGRQFWLGLRYEGGV
ncbi:TonB-dependent receptor domain-containing protein [Rubrivivax gelatinosus]|uniref:TonB-dependent receptor n=1 Tax=Rubrivivax gelatinosus TaxID=28068 RepID=A0ABS1DPQ3_RUBGE|nr:TonB-dependent receptor [Rubrivivax gelatinosus]MBK1711438.1 TonB-dependent receptor [Rubrivivax gelatinosus]